MNPSNNRGARFRRGPPRTPSHRSDRATSPEAAGRENARYLELAKAALAAGDTIAAENYYQHAEHYFRTARAARNGEDLRLPAADTGPLEPAPNLAR